jgi:senataxin
LKADFISDFRPKISGGFKRRRAPVAPPATDGFGRPLDAAGRVVEASRPPPKTIEESSTSESESDDDDTGGLFSIAKENKSPPKIRKVEKRKVQLLGEPVRSRIALQAREKGFRGVVSERDIRARLEPDLTSFLRTVLAWTPGHTAIFPPGTKQTDFKRVEATFTSPNKYEETYEPLLMLECWQHILQAKSESLEERFEFLIENRQKTDEYIELFVTMRPNAYANVGLLEPDLVIVSNRQGSGGKECFAKVQGMKKKKDSVELALRCLPPSEMSTCLVPKATMFGVKLFRFIRGSFC